MSCNSLRRLLRSCRLFLPKRYPRIEKIMADLAAIKDSLVLLDGKVDAHLGVDAAAVLELTNANTALQTQVVDLTAALAAAGASPEDIAAVVAQVEAISAKL